MDSTDDNMPLCSNYLLLKPEKASIFDLICILFSSNIDKRKFVECPTGAKEPFQSRWVIFLSVFLQKLLKLISKPLARFGSALEHSLNLFKSNGNVIGLFFNTIRGKVVIPDEASASYTSAVGLLDKRLDLDPNIKQGDDRYYAALSMMAAKLSYENKKFIEATVKNHWKMDFLGSFDFGNVYQKKASTQAFLFREQNEDSEVIIVAFRGTKPFSSNDWCSCFDLSWYEFPGVGKVHAGFMKALGLQKTSGGWPKDVDENQQDVAYYSIRKMLRDILQKNDNAKFIVTGHSMGAALAILFPAILMFHEETLLLQRLECIYTFAQPRVGDHRFGEYLMNKIANNDIGYFRVVYCNDIVPRIPFDNSAFMFKHFGTCIYYDSFYKPKIIGEEPNKNYFSLLWYLPKVINAIWELIRSFLIGYILGEEYKEGGFLRLMRMVGLLVPGIPAHIPQDYVNATRLGYPELNLPIHELRIKNK